MGQHYREKDGDYLLIISMFGTKRTKQNVIRTGVLSVNLVSTDMLELMDYFGTHHAEDGKKEDISYDVCRERSWMFRFWTQAGGSMNVKWCAQSKPEILPPFSAESGMFR